MEVVEGAEAGERSDEKREVDEMESRTEGDTLSLFDMADAVQNERYGQRSACQRDSSSQVLLRLHSSFLLLNSPANRLQLSFRLCSPTYTANSFPINSKLIQPRSEGARATIVGLFRWSRHFKAHLLLPSYTRFASPRLRRQSLSLYTATDAH